MKCKSIGMIGCGNMGSAFLAAAAKAFPDITRYVYDPDSNKTQGIDALLCSSPEETAASSDITILAVKPQILPEVCSTLKGRSYISLAAGITLSQLKGLLRTREVVRCMPTIAAVASASPVAVTWDTSEVPLISEDAMALADAAGFALWMKESLISAFIGVSGSGIAYVFQFLHALALGGTRSGLTYDQSLALAKQTLLGAVSFLDKTSMNPAQAVTMVTSPGGTTIEGIFELESGGFTPSLMNAVAAAAERSKNMQ